MIIHEFDLVSYSTLQVHTIRQVTKTKMQEI